MPQPTRSSSPVRIVDYDPLWPGLFLHQAARIRAALGPAALLLEHVGSTSVPGLAAKPVVDILLAVADSALEDDYAPALLAAGYLLRVREPEWYQHRMFNRPETAVNLHVFPLGCPEIVRMLTFRDWLRKNTADRELYQRTKRVLARKKWRDVQDYADAKTEVISAIMTRATPPEPL